MTENPLVYQRGPAVSSARDAVLGTSVAERSGDMLAQLHVPRGSAAHATQADIMPLVLDAKRCGWDHAFLTTLSLHPGQSHRWNTQDHETVCLPLSGSFTVTAGDVQFQLAGRASVFQQVSDFVYVGRGTDVVVTSATGGELACPNAPADRDIAPWYGAASQVEIETRGAGHATRQLTNFLAPHVGETCRLTCVEVLTPRGNWSSYPPHKHDVEVRDANGVLLEADLDEIYYFKTELAHGFGMHRTYDLRAGWDVSAAVHDGDAFLVPTGYHGPCIASPDSALWYLNVLAGASPERSLAFSDDPAHAHVRTDWAGQQTDPRVPMVNAEGAL